MSRLAGPAASAPGAGWGDRGACLGSAQPAVRRPWRGRAAASFLPSQRAHGGGAFFVRSRPGLDRPASGLDPRQRGYHPAPRMDAGPRRLAAGAHHLTPWLDARPPLRAAYHPAPRLGPGPSGIAPHSGPAVAVAVRWLARAACELAIAPCGPRGLSAWCGGHRRRSRPTVDGAANVAGAPGTIANVAGAPGTGTPGTIANVAGAPGTSTPGTGAYVAAAPVGPRRAGGPGRLAIRMDRGARPAPGVDGADR